MKLLMINIKDIDGSLTGKILIANPYCSFGDIFDKCIIYVASHSPHGAIGLIVNKFATNFDLKKLYRISDKSIPDSRRKIFIGGPVEPERSFILHSTDYTKNLLFPATSNLAISSNLEIVKDILNSCGPKQSQFILGYTAWGIGEIEKEIENNYWLILESDNSIIFDQKNDIKWQSALNKAGVDSNYFASQIGHS